jgi:hypothetical protein
MSLNKRRSLPVWQTVAACIHAAPHHAHKTTQPCSFLSFVALHNHTLICLGPVWHSSASPVELFFGKQLHEQLHEQGRAMFLQLHHVLNSVRESFQRSWAESWSFDY